MADKSLFRAVSFNSIGRIPIGELTTTNEPFIILGKLVNGSDQLMIESNGLEDPQFSQRCSKFNMYTL